MTKISRQNSPIKSTKDYYCSHCDYKCCKQSDFDKHETTRKHQKLANTNFVGEIRSKNWRELVYVSEKYFRPAEVEELLGDSTKARTHLGWSQEYTFDTLVQEMVDCDCK